METIEQWRRKMNQLDTRLLQLLNRRMRISQVIGKLKQRRGRQLRSPSRERIVLRRLTSLNRGPLDESAIQRLFQSILRESRRVQAIAVRRSRRAK